MATREDLYDDKMHYRRLSRLSSDLKAANVAWYEGQLMLVDW